MIYFFSGLGVDKRVFKNLKILEEFFYRFMDWIYLGNYDLKIYVSLFID